MVKRLIRSRALDRYRNPSGEFMVAVDAVHLHTREGVHSNLTHKTVDWERKIFYFSLEAKLDSKDGMGLSLATVFIKRGTPWASLRSDLLAVAATTAM